MTIDDINPAIAHAPADKKVDVARKMLDKYDDPDKELIEPDLLSSAMFSQNLAQKTPIILDSPTGYCFDKLVTLDNLDD